MKLLSAENSSTTTTMARNVRAVATTLGKSTPVQNEGQSVATLLVMVTVLTIIVIFCCFSAPGIRGLCKKYIFKCHCCRRNNNTEAGGSSGGAPTVILLPYGRILVVDRATFGQLRADQSGLDLLTLSARLIANRHRASTPEAPPAYDEVFSDPPPSYDSAKNRQQMALKLSV